MEKHKKLSTPGATIGLDDSIAERVQDMASIDRREIKCRDGRIVVRYYVRYYSTDGKRNTLPGGFSRKKDAEVALGRMLAEQAAGTFGKPSQEILFTEVARLWLEKIKPEVGVRTFIDYQQVVGNHLLSYFGAKRIRDITTVDVERFRNETLLTVSPRTTNKILRVLKMTLGYAAKHKYVLEDPTRFVASVKQVKKETDFLGRVESDEIERLLAAASPAFRPLFYTAIWTGMREGELLGLKWAAVDLDKQRINVRQTYDSYGYREPKSKAGKRSIVMSPSLVEVLSQHKVTLKNNGNDDHVFQNTKGGPLHHANMISREFHPALQRAGIRRMPFHCLRHTFGALTASMGTPPKFIQAQMGHASLVVTLDTYGHLMPSADSGFGDRLDCFVHDFVHGK